MLNGSLHTADKEREIRETTLYPQGTYIIKSRQNSRDRIFRVSKLYYNQYI